MNAQNNQCGRCGGPLAMMDAVCAACGEPVAVGQRLGLLGARAEGLASEGLYAQAARVAETLLALPLPAQDAKLWWRKRGAWLQRSGQPGAMEEAEAVLYASLRLDDTDDLSHQLWIDLLHRQGRLDKARAEYKQRLESDPADAVAQRQLAALRLMEDLKAAPLPKSGLPEEKEGLLIRMIIPTTGKMITAGIGLASCLYMLCTSGSAGPSIPGIDSSESLNSIVKLAQDPLLNISQIVVYGAYLAWGWKRKHEA